MSSKNAMPAYGTAPPLSGTRFHGEKRKRGVLAPSSCIAPHPFAFFSFLDGVFRDCVPSSQLSQSLVTFGSSQNVAPPFSLLVGSGSRGSNASALHYDGDTPASISPWPCRVYRVTGKKGTRLVCFFVLVRVEVGGGRGGGQMVW